MSVHTHLVASLPSTSRTYCLGTGALKGPEGPTIWVLGGLESVLQTPRNTQFGVAPACGLVRISVLRAYPATIGFMDGFGPGASKSP